LHKTLVFVTHDNTIRQLKLRRPSPIFGSRRRAAALRRNPPHCFRGRPRLPVEIHRALTGYRWLHLIDSAGLPLQPTVTPIAVQRLTNCVLRPRPFVVGTFDDGLARTAWSCIDDDGGGGNSVCASLTDPDGVARFFPPWRNLTTAGCGSVVQNKQSRRQCGTTVRLYGQGQSAGRRAGRLLAAVEFPACGLNMHSSHHLVDAWDTLTLIHPSDVFSAALCRAVPDSAW